MLSFVTNFFLTLCFVVEQFLDDETIAHDAGVWKLVRKWVIASDVCKLWCKVVGNTSLMLSIPGRVTDFLRLRFFASRHFFRCNSISWFVLAFSVSFLLAQRSLSFRLISSYLSGSDLILAKYLRCFEEHFAFSSWLKCYTQNTNQL